MNMLFNKTGVFTVLAATITAFSAFPSTVLADSVGGALGGARIDNSGLHLWFADNWKKCGSDREFHYDINSGNFSEYVELVGDAFINRYQIHIEFYCQNGKHIVQSVRPR